MGRGESKFVACVIEVGPGLTDSDSRHSMIQHDSTKPQPWPRPEPPVPLRSLFRPPNRPASHQHCPWHPDRHLPHREESTEAQKKAPESSKRRLVQELQRRRTVAMIYPIWVVCGPVRHGTPASHFGIHIAPSLVAHGASKLCLRRVQEDSRKQQPWREPPVSLLRCDFGLQARSAVCPHRPSSVAHNLAPASFKGGLEWRLSI